MQYLQIGVVIVKVADHWQAVCPNGDGRERAIKPGAIDSSGVAASTGGIAAVQHLQVAVGIVIIADHRQAVRPDGDGLVRAHNPGVIEARNGIAAGADGCAAV